MNTEQQKTENQESSERYLLGRVNGKFITPLCIYDERGKWIGWYTRNRREHPQNAIYDFNLLASKEFCVDLSSR